MIKLSRDQVNKILQVYDLGSLKEIKQIRGGYVNYNFDLKTTAGNFIIQIIGDVFNNWKRKKLGIQFKLLMFLKNQRFPYEIPCPLKNKYGKFLLKFNSYHLWIYRKIEGKVIKKYNLSHFKEVAKALAIYHKFVKDFNYSNKDFFDCEWLLEKYFEMRKIRAKNKLDKLMLKNIDFFESILLKINEIDFTKSKLILTHSDFSNENILFKDNNLVGIIDFDNLELAPIGKDIAIAIKRSNYLGKGFNKRKQNIFLREYQKYFSLSAIDKKLIIPLLIKDNCSLFWWFYSGIRKRTNKKKALLEIIKATKKLVKLSEYKIK